MIRNMPSRDKGRDRGRASGGGGAAPSRVDELESAVKKAHDELAVYKAIIAKQQEAAAQREQVWHDKFKKMEEAG